MYTCMHHELVWFQTEWFVLFVCTCECGINIHYYRLLICFQKPTLKCLRLGYYSKTEIVCHRDEHSKATLESSVGEYEHDEYHTSLLC